MRLEFTRHGDRFDLVVTGTKGPDLILQDHDTGRTLPHDLVHAVVERALGIEDGFCGALARGATFKGFQRVVPARHQRSGLKTLRRSADRVLAAELKVNWAVRAWEGRDISGPGVGGPQLSEPELRVAVAVIEEAARRWRALDDGDVLVIDW